MPIWDSFHTATCNINFSVCWISLFSARFRPPYHPGPQAMMGQVCIFPLCSSKRFCYGKFVDHVLFLILKKNLYSVIVENYFWLLAFTSEWVCTCMDMRVCVCVFPCFVHLSLKINITVLLSMVTACISSLFWLYTLCIYSLS